MPNFLHDAIIFHRSLNPALWDGDEMIPEVRSALMAMAVEFQDFLGLGGDLEVIDIVVAGSNAAYTYTPHSDIDLHLIVRTPIGERGELYKELFDAKKNLFNNSRQLTVKGYNVEFYVQMFDEKVTSIGVYSVTRAHWINYPKRTYFKVDDMAILSKVDSFTVRINEALRGEDYNAARKLWEDIKNMRKAGLAEGGEFSVENITYKILRTRGLTAQLFDYIIELKDKQLSLESVNPGE